MQIIELEGRLIAVKSPGKESDWPTASLCRAGPGPSENLISELSVQSNLPILILSSQCCAIAKIISSKIISRIKESLILVLDQSTEYQLKTGKQGLSGKRTQGSKGLFVKCRNILKFKGISGINISLFIKSIWSLPSNCNTLMPTMY